MPGRSQLFALPLGVGCAVPDTRVTNADLRNMIEVPTDEAEGWIRKRTGIESRHILKGGTPLASLAADAARRALEQAGCDPLDVDLVVLATSSPDSLFGDAPAVAARVGAVNAVAFDLTAACSGFLFGVVTAAQFLHSGAYQRALVIGADALTRWVNWGDRNTCVLFGDAAGALLLAASSECAVNPQAPIDGGGREAPNVIANEFTTSSRRRAGVLGFAMHSDGSSYEAMTLRYSSKDSKRGGYGCIAMEGRQVFSFATLRVPQVVREALDNAGISIDEVDWLLLHQANSRILEQVSKSLGVPTSKVITNLHEYGNTSGGSIPLALAEAVGDGRVEAGHVVACAGFGAGLSWGACIFRWGGAEATALARTPRARDFAPP